MIILLEDGMIKIHVSALKPGMIVAKTIYDSDGTILISAGVALKETYIEGLRKRGIGEIYIQTDETVDIVIQDVIQEKTRMDAKRVMQETMNRIGLGKEIHTQEVFAIVDRILEDLLSNPDILVNLSDIRSVDEYTFSHCVNVCVLSVLTGVAMKYSRDELRTLGMGAILHDIGKMMIPKEILNKPGKLTKEEYEIIKKHPQFGHKILEKYPNINDLIRLVVLTHHERFDGKGYPFGLKGEEIHEFSRIVSIADVYDAMTSERAYNKKNMPHKAIEYLISMGNHQFDYEMTKTFVRHIAYFPLGTVVRLSTGDIAVVIGNNKNYPYRPKVRCLWKADGERIFPGIEIDLERMPSVTIVEVLENIKF